MRIAIIGLGKLGSCMLAYYASKGHKVIGIDINKEFVDMLNNGNAPVMETNLQKYLNTGKHNYHCYKEYEGVRNVDLIFIIVPTPTDETGEFSNKYIKEVLEQVCQVIKSSDDYKVIIVTSTVKLGSMRNEFMPLIESVSGKVVGRDIGLLYNPEFIALGNVINGLAEPDAVLIGELDGISGDKLKYFYNQTLDKPAPIFQMSWENAELSKIGLNVSLVTKIGLANTFAALCEKIEGGDVDKVTEFIGADSRIGKKYFSGGLSPAGTCFPRDAKAFINMAKRLVVKTDIIDATDEYNRCTYHYQVMTKILKHISPEAKKVSVLGLTFKPDTPITEESISLKIIEWLSQDYNVVSYDPMAKHITSVDDVKECLKDSSMVIIATPWVDFKYIRPKEYKVMKEPVIVDCWRLLDRESLVNEGIEYHALGVND